MGQLCISMAAILNFKMAAHQNKVQFHKKSCIRMSDIISMLFVPNLNLLQCLQHVIWAKIHFKMAAILKFKMADEDVVEKMELKFFGFSTPKLTKLANKINFGTKISRDFIVASTITGLPTGAI